MLVWMNDDAYNLSLNCNSYVVTIQGITYKLLFIRRYFSIKRTKILLGRTNASDVKSCDLRK